MSEVDDNFFKKMSADLRKVRSASQVNKKTKEAISWYLGKIVKNAPKEISLSAVMYKQKAIKKLIPGTMMTYRYQSKGYNEGTLPYFDASPMIIFLDVNKHGNWLGLNIHYLPPHVRAKVFAYLLKNVKSKVIRHDNRLPVNYKKVRAIAQLEPLQFAIKSYIPANAQGKLIRIQPKEWDKAIFLPTAKFIGKSARGVWKQNF